MVDFLMQRLLPAYLHTHYLNSMSLSFFIYKTGILIKVQRFLQKPKTELPYEQLTRGRNGKLLQHSCWENPMNRGAWEATLCGVAKSPT